MKLAACCCRTAKMCNSDTKQWTERCQNLSTEMRNRTCDKMSGTFLYLCSDLRSRQQIPESCDSSVKEGKMHPWVSWNVGQTGTLGCSQKLLSCFIDCVFIFIMNSPQLCVFSSEMMLFLLGRRSVSQMLTVCIVKRKGKSNSFLLQVSFLHLKPTFYHMRPVFTTWKKNCGWRTSAFLPTARSREAKSGCKKRRDRKSVV